MVHRRQFDATVGSQLGVVLLLVLRIWRYLLFVIHASVILMMILSTTLPTPYCLSHVYLFSNAIKAFFIVFLNYVFYVFLLQQSLLEYSLRALRWPSLRFLPIIQIHRLIHPKSTLIVYFQAHF